VGLGGRLDAVNIIDADVALLTSVGLDHQDWLGHERESIGLEKAGIFRTARPAICAEISPPESVLVYAREIDANCLVFGQAYRIDVLEGSWSWHGPDKQSRYGLPMPSLRGNKQIENAAAVIMVIETLASRMPVSQSHLRQGLREVSLPGRFQVLVGDPPVILDVAHNPQAIEVLVDNLQAFACSGRVLAVFGMLEDKDVAGVVKLLAAKVDQWYLASINAARGLDAVQLAPILESAGIKKYHLNHDISSAFDKARADARAGDCILVCGSFYSVAEVLRQQRVKGY
jgi:dihydrofolate synthase/folylpolyglutamate synthase